MVVGSAVLMSLLEFQISLPRIILIYAVLNLLASIYAYTLIPKPTLRFLTWVLASCIYRVRGQGFQQVPAEGPALLVCNHVSFIDWLVISAVIKRPIRFVMYYKFADVPIFRHVFKHCGVIPIAGRNEDPEVFEEAFITTSESLKNGDLVCIFPEGSLTRTCEIQAFKKGIEYILAENPVPVVPLGLSGLWGSFFSHQGSPALKKIPKRIRHPVSLRVGDPIPPENLNLTQLESKVKELASVTLK